MGLIVAPSCNDCHGAHKIKRSIDRDSPINHANVAKTCGKCHVGIEATYNQSVHGQLLAKGDPRGPVCIDCHSAHQIVNPTGTISRPSATSAAANATQDRLEHYRETYHGKAMALGKPNSAPEVAACYDCHGFHDMLPPSNPASHLSKNNILATCQKCHPGATAKFTEYQPHANPLDKKNYPLLHVVFLAMTGLLIGTFASSASTRWRGWCARFGCICTTQKRSARRRSRRRRTTNGSRASCRLSGSCISSS